MPYEVTTPVFTGDLELLTQMVSRQELDVFQICLAALIEAFLAEAKVRAEREGELDLEETTEFLLLAATLLELKTRFLLLDDEDDTEEEIILPEDRDVLLANLLQGRTFKEAARALSELIALADRSAPRRAGPEEPLASVEIDPLESVDVESLRAALWRALAPRPVVDLYHVTPIRASVSDAIDWVMGSLTRYEQLSLFDLLEDEPEPEPLERIVRFLAVLELYKQGLVELEQAVAFGDLIVRSRPPDPEELDLTDATREMDPASYGEDHS